MEAEAEAKNENLASLDFGATLLSWSRGILLTKSQADQDVEMPPYMITVYLRRPHLQLSVTSANLKTARMIAVRTRLDQHAWR